MNQTYRRLIPFNNIGYICDAPRNSCLSFLLKFERETKLIIGLDYELEFANKNFAAPKL